MDGATSSQNDLVRRTQELSIREDDSAEREEDDDLDDLDDLDMPFGANEENKELHRLVKGMEQQVAEIDAEIESNNARVSSMQDHLKNVQQEEKMTDSVSAARKKEVESEEAIAMLDNRERSKLEIEAKKLKEEIVQFADSQNTYQNDIFKFQAEIDELRQQMDWDESRLKDFLEEARQKEEDADILQKYSQADGARVKELRLQLEKLATEAQGEKRKLDQEVMNTRSHELGLDKVAELYKNAHHERNEVIKQWEATMRQMQEEDAAIEAAAERFQELKGEAAIIARSVVEEREFVENEKAGNIARDTELEKQERQLTRLDDERTRAVAELGRFQTELESLRAVTTRVSADELAKKRDIESLREAVSIREHQRESLEEEILAAEAAIEDAKKENLSSEEQMLQLEREADTEARQEDRAQRELTAASLNLSKQKQEVHELQQRHHLAESGISSLSQSNRNLGSRIRAVEKQRLNEQQLMYKQDFQITVLERKLLRMNGAIGEDEKVELKAEIESLNENLSSHVETKKLLTAQLRKVEDSTRLSKRKRDTVAGQLATVSNRLYDIELYNTGAKKELDRLVQDKQNLMVEENLLKLEIRRLRKRLNAKADDVLSLEQRKLQLKMAMEERLQEVTVHKGLLNEQRLECTRRRTAVAKELEERRTRVGQLKKKHDIVSFSLKGPDGEEQQSQAALIVRLAQERNQLQQQGDELDSKIRKREKEIRMLDNTLQLMNGHNQKYRDSLRRVDAETEELATKEHLEAQLRTVLDKYKHKRRELRSKEEELDQVQRGLEANRTQLDEISRLRSELQGQLQNIENELSDQQAKIDRAAKRAQKMVATFRKDAGGPAGETVAEKDFRLKQIREFNSKVMDKIDAVVEEVPDIRPMVSMLYDRAGIIRPPARPGSSRGTSRGSSRASSVSSFKSSVRSTASSRASTRGATRSQPATAQEAAAAHQSRNRPITPKTVQIGLGL